MLKKTVLAVALVVAAATGAAAEYRGPGYGYRAGDTIDRRQEHQDRRIEAGRRDGSLTRYEAEALRREQARIADMERRARSDGYVTATERGAIARAQSEASRQIYQERHDSDRRRGWWGGWRR